MTVQIEVLADGGIRVEAPGTQGGLASLRMTRGWMQVAAERKYPVTVTGDVSSPSAMRIIDDIRRDDVPVIITPAAPAPWPKGWTSLQIAAASGLVEQVQDLIDRGASMRTRRRDLSLSRLAVRTGHVGVLKALRDAGAPVSPGSQPPGDLPDAVVFRNYLPAFTWWFAIASVVVGSVLAVAVWHWAFLIVAVFGILAILVANVVIGRTRIAVDGPRLSVRQVVRWQGPIDVRELVAVGYSPAVSRRMSSRWRLVQRQAGDEFGVTARDGFEPPLADHLKQLPDLRVVTVYCGRDFLSPGFERHLAAYVPGSSARISTNAQSVFDGLDIRND